MCRYNKCGLTTQVEELLCLLHRLQVLSAGGIHEEGSGHSREQCLLYAMVPGGGDTCMAVTNVDVSAELSGLGVSVSAHKLDYGLYVSLNFQAYDFSVLFRDGNMRVACFNDDGSLFPLSGDLGSVAEGADNGVA